MSSEKSKDYVFIPPEIAGRMKYTVYIAIASEEASRSMCLTRRVGAVVVNQEGFILGRGANAPPDYQHPQQCNKVTIPKMGGPNDRHCCLHAEQVALLDALSSEDMKGSTLVFVDIDGKNKIIPAAGKPYCTQCSKLALYLGVEWWVCYHAAGVWPEGEGFYRYTAKQYNELSFAFREPTTAVQQRCLCQDCTNRHKRSGKEPENQKIVCDGDCKDIDCNICPTDMHMLSCDRYAGRMY